MIAGISIAIACMLAAPPVQSPLRPPAHGVYVVAHRGAHQGIPENTLAAYREAIRLGADFVEIDLRTTRDGALVSAHNATVDAYTDDATGPVSGFTLAELKALDIGSGTGPEWGEERIPSFDEILTLCKGKIGIYLDLKDGQVPAILSMVRAFGMTRDVLWYAAPRRLEELRALCPECIPMPDPGPESLLPRVLAREPKVVAAVWKFFSARFVQQVHDTGALVIVDEDSPASWPQALAWKADGIQTDDPAGLIAFLHAQPPVASAP